MHKKLSVIIPAYNEESILESTLSNIKNTLADLNLDFEIIVSNNNSTDKTKLIAKNYDCIVIDQPERSISKTRNAGAKAASGDLFLFLDADSKLTRNLTKKSLDYLNHGYRVISSISTFDKYNTLVSYGVWIYNILSYLFKLGTGQFILINKTDFQLLGGFDEDIYGFEDMYFFKKARKKIGRNKIKILSSPIVTSGRKFTKEKDQFTFVFQLLGVLLNKPIGKSKANLEFWYGKQSLEKINYKLYILIAIIFMLFFDNHIITENNFINTYKNISTLFLFIAFASLVFKLKPFLIISITSLIVEIIGESTGIPFGFYKYNEYYSKIGIFDVPLFIPIAWYLLITTNSKIFSSPLKAGLSIVFIDVFLEKFAELNNIWKWETPYLITAPIANYATWFIMSYLLYKYVKQESISLFYSSTVLMLLCGYIGTNLILNDTNYGIFLIIYSLYIFSYSVNKKIQSYIN
jgi:glycosyltransferase involved in cell wall biosynthesis